MREPAEKDGSLTVRGMWLKLAEREGWEDRAWAELNKGPEVPEVSGYIWEWWSELDSGRRYGFGGPEPLSFGDIRDWAELSGRDPTPQEVEALIMLDRTVLHPGKRE